MPQSYSTAQKLLPLLLDSVQDYAIFLMDTQGRVVTWTPGVERLLGYSEGEFVGQNSEILFVDEDLRNGAPIREMQSALQHGRAEDVRWHIRKNGDVFWANGQMIALRGENGELCGFAKILRDETRHKHAEDALRAVRERLQTALDVGRIGTWEWDIQNNRVVADANYARFFDLTSAEAANSPVERFLSAVHPDDLALVNRAISQSIESCGPFAVDCRLSRPDGQLWVEARGRVQPDAQGRAAFLNGVMLDISERKRAEAALQHSEERYRTLFDAMNSGFCVVEMIFDDANQPVDYRFLEINPAFEQQTRLREATGKTVRELVPDLDKHWIRTYGQVALTGEPIHFQNSDDAMGRTFDVHAFRFGAAPERHVALLFTDISQQKRGEEALRQAHTQSQATNRMKDEFMATLSHELRTPLNAILGWSNLLRFNDLDPATQLQGLETIERNARAQAGLVNDLLDVSRILTGKMRLELRPIEIADVLEQVIDTVTPALGAKGIELEREIDAFNSSISGDPNRLAQVFWNVLSNAIKFTPGGGRIHVSLARAGEDVQVQIRDSGAGISPEFLPFVFERFRQADASSTRAFGGLGIGLSLVRHLVEAHGGTVRAQSAGQSLGATFVLTFPATAHAAISTPEITFVDTSYAPDDAQPSPLEKAGESAPGAQNLDLSELQILVVDDEPDARELVKLALAARGARVEIAADAASAFALFERNHSFDVLISDIAMLGEDGYTLMRRLRSGQKARALPAIALTAYANSTDRVNALLAGFQVHIAKPVDPLELVVTVASLTKRIKSGW